MRPPWFAALRTSVLDKCIRLVVLSYPSIQNTPHASPPKENQRRNELVLEMRRRKAEVGLVSAIITAESAEISKDAQELGRMDISLYYAASEDEHMTFECKRFLRKHLNHSYFQSQFNGEGIQRFMDGSYSFAMPMAGTIAFIESGSYQKAYQLFQDELPQTGSVVLPVQELSALYRHSYILRTNHVRTSGAPISLTHILLDLTGGAPQKRTARRKSAAPTQQSGSVPGDV